MICVNQETFKIAEDVIGDDWSVLPNWFECDDMIAESIASLNKRGYKTEFCCQGHIATSLFDYSTNDCINKITVSTPYIVFDKKYSFETLPDGWNLVDHEGEMIELDDGTEVEDHRISIYYDKIADKYCGLKSYCTGIIMEFYIELVQVMKDLLEWVLSLPFNK